MKRMLVVYTLIFEIPLCWRIKVIACRMVVDEDDTKSRGFLSDPKMALSRVIQLETRKLIMWWDGNEYPCGHSKMEVYIWELDKN